MLPYSRLFDQRTLALMVEHDAIVQRYRALFALIEWQVLPDPVPERTAETCEHEQFLKDKGCVKDLNIEKGGLMRAMLNRTSPLYRAVYRQRTSAERINSQAKARCIERAIRAPG